VSPTRLSGVQRTIGAAGQVARDPVRGLACRGIERVRPHAKVSGRSREVPPGNEGIRPLSIRIAIVEDEPALREAVAEYLGATGYHVTAVDCASAMRTLVETETFHLAILDIAMPGEDGLSLGRWLRSQMPIGIIYATAAGTSIDRI